MIHAVLDTNLLILHVAGEVSLDFIPKTLAISTVSLFESLCLPGMSEKEIHALEKLISLCEVFSVSREIAYRGALLGRNQNSRPVDLLIAATALELDVPLITKNVKDFRNIKGLKVQTKL